VTRLILPRGTAALALSQPEHRRVAAVPAAIVGEGGVAVLGQLERHLLDLTTLGDVLDALKEEHDPKNGIHYLGSVGLRQATTYAYLEGGTVALQNNEDGAEPGASPDRSGWSSNDVTG